MTCLSGKTRGTCDDTACPLHGLCHCGCGQEAKVCIRNCSAAQQVRGNPWMYRSGHNPGTRGAGFTGADDPRRMSGAIHLSDVPAEKVLPLARFLIETYGSVRAAAAVAGVNEYTMQNLVSGRTKAMYPRVAKPIVETVLAHRRPGDRFGTYERVRLPVPQERLEARREKDAADKRYYRNKARARNRAMA